SPPPPRALSPLSLRLPRHPRPTLFPYTTLFRSKPLREKHSQLGAFWHTDFGPLNQVIHAWPYENLQHRTAVREAMANDAQLSARSEEHTSELQSRGHLVCRLLLEKKKQNTSKLD